MISAGIDRVIPQKVPEQIPNGPLCENVPSTFQKSSKGKIGIEKEIPCSLSIQDFNGREVNVFLFCYFLTLHPSNVTLHTLNVVCTNFTNLYETEMSGFCEMSVHFSRSVLLANQLKHEHTWWFKQEEPSGLQSVQIISVFLQSALMFC